MISLVPRRRLEWTIRVVEDAIAGQATTLEIATVVEGNSDDLLSCLHLFNDLEIGAVKDLDVAFIEGYANELVISACVKHLEFARRLCAQL